MTYLGYDILELNYNRLGTVLERVPRKAAILDPGTGLRMTDAQAPAPAPSRPFRWTAFGRAEVAAMLAFLDARKGRAVPFWFPSLQWDLSLAEDALETEATLSISLVGYCEQLWGTTGARRHIALWPVGAPSMDCHEIISAVDPEDGLTETLGINPAAAQDWPADSTVISFLKFCRLEDDLMDVSYPLPGVAEASIVVRELPLEAPVSS